MDDEKGTMFSSAFGGQHEPKKKSLENVEVNLDLTLEELYNGCVKVLKYKHKVLNSDGRTTIEKESLKEIEIFKGYESNLKLTFFGLGNQAPGLKNCMNIKIYNLK